MSISSTLFNANSGLAAASRRAETIAHNVANAMTESYARREVSLSSVSVDGRGSGVRVAGVSRMIDEIALADRRLAEAETGAASLRHAAYLRLEQTIGIPGSAGALSEHVTAFEAALLSAEAEPQSTLRHQNVLVAAKDLAVKLNQISNETQAMREEADRKIDGQVQLLNTTLQKIEELNHKIRTQIATGNDGNGLMDQRQELVDRIAETVPLHVVRRDHGAIALLSAGGAVLLDGTAARFDFTPTRMITPDMSLASGALSGLAMNGKPVSFSGDYVPLGGGTLAAAFDLRDSIAPAASGEIDRIARNLVERFQDPALDTTIASGSPGLFTDDGLALDGLNVTGLARRLAVNTAVDPSDGGALWRLRDGLGATSPGPTGNSSLFTAFLSALDRSGSPPPPAGPIGADSFSVTVTSMVSLISGNRLETEFDKTFAAARLQEFRQIEAESGVDTDSEMQKLLLVEQAYAANARVVQTVGDMFNTLLEI